MELHKYLEETNCEGEVVYLGIQEDENHIHSCLECHEEIELNYILENNPAECEE